VKLERESPFGLSVNYGNSFFNFQKLLASYSDSLSTNDHLEDSLSLVCLNEERSFFKLSKGAAEDAAWKIEAIKVKGTHRPDESIINKVVPASNFPAVAILQN
jgi:predicted NACHT family NTPase